MEALLREKAKYNDLLVLTSLDQLVFILIISFSFFYKKVTLMRSSTVLSLPPQLAFNAWPFTKDLNKKHLKDYGLGRTAKHHAIQLVTHTFDCGQNGCWGQNTFRCFWFISDNDFDEISDISFYETLPTLIKVFLSKSIHASSVF